MIEGQCNSSQASQSQELSCAQSPVHRNAESLPPGQAWFTDFDNVLLGLPKDSYVEKLLGLTDGNLHLVEVYRARLFEKAKAVRASDCPLTETLKQRKTTKSGHKSLKYAKDCYLVQTFIDGATLEEINDVFNVCRMRSSSSSSQRRLRLIEDAVLSPMSQPDNPEDIPALTPNQCKHAIIGNGSVTISTNPAASAEFLEQNCGEPHESTACDTNTTSNQRNVPENNASDPMCCEVFQNTAPSTCAVSHGEHSTDLTKLSDLVNNIQSVTIVKIESEFRKLKESVQNLSGAEKISSSELKKLKEFIKNTNSSLSDNKSATMKIDNDLETLAAASEAQFNDLRDENTSLKAECGKLRADLNVANTEISELKENMTKLSKDMKSALQKCNSYDDLPRDFKEVKLGFERVKDLRDSGVSKLRNELKLIKADLKSSDQQQTDSVSKISDLRKMVDSMQSKVTVLDRVTCPLRKDSSFASRVRKETTSTPTQTTEEPEVNDAAAGTTSKTDTTVSDRDVNPVPPSRIETIFTTNQCVAGRANYGDLRNSVQDKRISPNTPGDSSAHCYSGNKENCLDKRISPNTPGDSEFVGVVRKPRRRRAVIFVGHISLRSTVDSVTDFLVKRDVSSPHVRLIKSKIWGTQSAKIIVNLNEKDKLLEESFWPEGISYREWID